MIRKKTVNIMWMIFLLILTGQTISAKPKSIKVHPYVPFTIPETGPGGEAYPSHVRNDVASARFNVSELLQSAMTIQVLATKGTTWMSLASPQTAGPPKLKSM